MLLVLRVESGRLQPYAKVNLCGKRYRIDTDAYMEEFVGGLETYDATQISTTNKVRLTFGGDLEFFDHNARFSSHLHANPTVDSKYFLQVHCVTKIKLENEFVFAQVEDNCPSLYEHIKFVQHPFIVRTVEMQLLPQIKDAIQEMRKLRFVHGNLDVRTLHWCSATEAGNPVVQLGGFHHAQVIPDGGTTLAAENCIPNPNYMDPEVCSHGLYYSTSDLYSVGGVILQMLQLSGLPQEAWIAALIQEKSRGLAELIQRLLRRPHRRLSFPAFYEAVDSLREEAEAEAEKKKNEADRQAAKPLLERETSDDSFVAAIDSIMSDGFEPKTSANKRIASDAFEEVHFPQDLSNPHDVNHQPRKKKATTDAGRTRAVPTGGSEFLKDWWRI